MGHTHRFALIAALVGSLLVAGLPARVSADVLPAEPTVPASNRLSAEDLGALMGAELAIHRKDHQLALDLYAPLALRLNDVEVLERAARLAAWLKDPRGLELVNAWAAAAPEDVRALRLRAAELSRAGQHGEAFAVVEKLAVHHDDVRFTPFVEALGPAVREMDLDVWISRLYSIRVLAPGYDTRRALMLLLRAAARGEEALSLLTPADQNRADMVRLHASILQDLGRGKECGEVLAAALERGTSDARLEFMLARLRLAQVRYAEAQGLLEDLFERFPRNTEVMISLAWVHLQQQKYAGARMWLGALEARGGYPDLTQLYLGEIARAEDRPRKAIEHFERVSLDADEYLAAREGRAQALADTGEVTAARQQLRDLREAYPEDRIRLTLVETDVLVRAKHLADARQVLDQALSENDGNTDLLYSRALIRERLDDIDGAEADLLAVLDAYPDNANALNALGYTLADRTDRYAEALRLISRALEQQPDDPAFIDSMGWVQYRLGHLDEAAQWLRRAYGLLQDAEVAVHLAEVLWVAGQQDEAKAVWLEALERDPESLRIKEAVLRLTGATVEALRTVVRGLETEPAYP